LTVNSRASGILDPTGEGVSVVDCVTDDFWGETVVDLYSRRFRGCGSCRYVAADFGSEVAVDLCNCRFWGYYNCRYVIADFGGEAAVDLCNCRFWGNP